MFFVCINAFPLVSSAEPVYPELTDYVNDYASMFDDASKQSMRIVLEELESATTAQIFVATVDNLQGVSIEEYAVKLFEKWGIGQAEKDNGLLILIAKQERKIRIEVGYGLEPVITDAIAGRTINDIMTPRFKNGEFGLGTHEAVVHLADLISKDAGVSLTSLGQTGGSQETTAPSGDNFDKYFGIGCCSFVFILFSLIITIVTIIRKRCPNCKKLKLKTTYVILEEATYKESGLQLVKRNCSNCGFHDEKETKIPRKSRSSGGGSFGGSFGGRGSSGGSSGGGFSGGGGSSGGGGASGGW